MSEFKVPVVRIGKLEKHPNADRLSITEIDGCPVICQTSEFKEGNVAVYVPIEAVVPLDKKSFEFLRDPNHPDRTTARIKAKRLRGVFSMGLLVPIQAVGWDLNRLVFHEGEDLAAALGVVKYEEPETEAAPSKVRPPKPWYKVLWAWIKHPVAMSRQAVRERRAREVSKLSFIPVYDMESLRKYRSTIEPGETVYVSEKIHGTNFRCGYYKGKFRVGSHRTWKAQGSNDLYTKTAERYGLEEKLRGYPHLAIYGEIYGDVQDLRYGCKQGETKLAVFDVYDSVEKRYLDYPSFVFFCDTLGLPRVPELYVGPYDPAVVDPLANGNTAVPGGKNIREGVVVKPIKERRAHVGRVIFKLVSEAYLLRNGGTERH